MKKSLKTTLFLAEYFILNIYLWYRYAFRYNSSSTSPTYNDTPVVWSVGKFLIIVAFLSTIIIVDKFRIKTKYPNKKVLSIVVTVSVVVLIKAIMVRDVDFFAKWMLMVWAAFPILTLRLNESFWKSFARLNRIVFIIQVAYSAIQIAAYLLTGRLPALGYAGSLVRFGGCYDDPNAFAMYLILPITYFACKAMEESKVKNYILLIVCLILMALTISFAGYLSLGIVFVFILKKYWKKKKMFCVFFGVITCVVIAIPLFSNKLLWLVEAKKGSAMIHLAFLMPRMQNATWKEYIVGVENKYFSENFYDLVLNYFGIVGLALYISIKVAIVRIAYLVKKESDDLYTYIMCVYIVAFTISQIGIPYTIVFPVNFLYWCCVFLVLQVRLNRHSKIQKAA